MGNSGLKQANQLATNFELKSPQPIIGGHFFTPKDQDPHSPQSRILIISRRRVEAFFLATGKRYTRVYESSPNLSFMATEKVNSLQGKALLILGDSAGYMHVIDPFTLLSLAHIAPLAFKVTANQGRFTGLSNAGSYGVVSSHFGGMIQIWDMFTFQVTQTIQLEARVIDHMAYAKSVLTVAFANDGTLENPLLLINLEEPEAENPLRLTEFAGECLALRTVPEKNLLIALNAAATVFVWDFITHYFILEFEVPTVILKEPVALAAMNLTQNEDAILIGGDDGTILLSELVLDGSEMIWKPFKCIDPTPYMATGITSLQYSQENDGLVIGTNQGRVGLLPNIAEVILDEVKKDEGVQQE